MNLQEIVLLVIKISIVLMVFGVGLHATFADGTYFFRHPRRLARALLAMNFFMPALALLLVMTLRLHPAVKIALVALAVSPVPPFFPQKALKGGGKDDYTVGLLAATGLLAIVLVPLTIKIVSGIAGVPMNMPAISVAKLVLLTVLAPLVAGIALCRIAPSFAERIAGIVGTLAMALLVLSSLPILFGSLRTIISLIGDGTLLSFAGFALVGYFLGNWLGGPEPENRPVLALATASRHPAIAAAIAHTNFPQQKLALPAIVLYLIVSAVVTGIAARQKNKIRPAKTENRLAA